MNLNKTHQNKIKKSLINIEKAKAIINRLDPLWNLELKQNKIPKEELLGEFYKLLNTQKDSAKIINHFFSKKDILKLAQYIADVDYTLNSDTVIINKSKKITVSKSRSSRGKTKGGDNSVELVEREEKRVFFDKYLCASLISILVGILLVYLAIENMNALNETYNLNITFSDLFTNFKATVESLPTLLMSSISKEAIYDIQMRVKRGCMSASANTITDVFSAYFMPSDTMACMTDGAVDGLNNTLNINSTQLKNGLKLCYTLTASGLSMLTGGGGYIYARLTGSNSKSMLSKDKSPQRRITLGGKKTIKNKTRKDNIQINFGDFL